MPRTWRLCSTRPRRSSRRVVRGLRPGGPGEAVRLTVYAKFDDGRRKSGCRSRRRFRCLRGGAWPAGPVTVLHGTRRGLSRRSTSWRSNERMAKRKPDYADVPRQSREYPPVVKDWNAAHSLRSPSPRALSACHPSPPAVAPAPLPSHHRRLRRDIETILASPARAQLSGESSSHLQRPAKRSTRSTRAGCSCPVRP